MRSAGILLHISSLPSPYGIGTMGKAAYEFADFLHASKQHYWQILPIGPTSYGDSPYQSFSTFAGNPYFIDLDTLVEDGLLLQDEIDEVDWSWSEKRVDYGLQFYYRYKVLRKAFERGRDRDAEKIDHFRRENTWVENYALYMAIKWNRNMQSWETWPDEIRLRKPGAVDTYATVYAEDMNFFIYLQYLFYQQWNALRDYVHSLDIEIIGDIPIYVPFDSCDVWANPQLFQLDDNATPTGVAGCPPDYFSADGQLWGNPLYDWDRMQETGFAWWKDRIAGAGKLFDVIRIDHFRGIESYWRVPYGDDTARNGAWIKGPDKTFVNMLHETFPHLKLIAEDLGYLTEAVHELLDMSGYPGMRVLVFAFDSLEPNNYLPHSFVKNSICYSGTHDNDTLVQWIARMPDEVIEYTMEYLGCTEKEHLPDAIIRAGMRSVADTFIAQIQDYLEIGKEGRMNEPSTLKIENWSWRLPKDALTEELSNRIARMTTIYERIV